MEQKYDRLNELTAFDETKAGVKGLVDGGVTKVPRIFISPPDTSSRASELDLSIPVIDLGSVGSNPIGRKDAVDIIREASATWGFFQVVNHGISVDILAEMLQGARRFYEQDSEIKKKWYTRDGSKTVVYNSNFDLFSSASANWRDTSYCSMAPNTPIAADLPDTCRDIMLEYSKEVKKLGSLLLELLSEAVGLNPDYLNSLGCSDGHAILSHYYPACPEPEKTLGASKHADYSFLTVLLQDDIGGLQVLCRNQWVDVPPVRGALVVNIGDLLQLISNDKLKSSQHRVVANLTGPRVSVACFFTTGLMPSPKLFGPIRELVSEENPPRYRDTTVRDYSLHYNAKGIGGSSALLDFGI